MRVLFLLFTVCFTDAMTVRPKTVVLETLIPDDFQEYLSTVTGQPAGTTTVGGQTPSHSTSRDINYTIEPTQNRYIINNHTSHDSDDAMTVRARAILVEAADPDDALDDYLLLPTKRTADEMAWGSGYISTQHAPTEDVTSSGDDDDNFTRSTTNVPETSTWHFVTTIHYNATSGDEVTSSGEDDDSFTTTSNDRDMSSTWIYASTQEGETTVSDVTAGESSASDVPSSTVSDETSSSAVFISSSTHANVPNTSVTTVPDSLTSTTDSGYPTTPPPEAGNWNDSFFQWNLSFALDITYNSASSDESLPADILEALEYCFDDPKNREYGYAKIDNTSISLSAYNYSSLPLRLTVVTTSDTNITAVRYIALYYAQTLARVGNISLVSQHINTVVMGKLKGIQIGDRNISTNDVYIEEITSQEIEEEAVKIEEELQDICASAASPDCPPGSYCYSNAADPALPCYEICYENITIDGMCCRIFTDTSIDEYCEERNQECTPNSNSDGFECRCSSQSLNLFDECLSKVWVIVTLAVISVVVIILCILVAVFALRPTNAFSFRKSKDEAGQARVVLDCSTNSTDLEIASTDALKTYQSMHTDVGFRSESPASTSDEESDSYLPQTLRESAAYTGFRANLMAVDTNTDYFPNRPTIKLRSDKNRLNAITKQTDVGFHSESPTCCSDDDSDSYLPQTLRESPAYTGFQANLMSVDKYTNCFTNRPTIQLRADNDGTKTTQVYRL